VLAAAKHRWYAVCYEIKIVSAYNFKREYNKIETSRGVCPDCQSREFNFDQSLQRMILAFKNGRTELDSTLGSWANSALQGADFYNDIEFFVPVLLHWSRRLVRGYLWFWLNN